MAFIPASSSVVAFQSDPTKLVGTVSVVGTLPVVLNNSSIITVTQGSIATVIIGGSIAANFTPPANQSVSGAVSISNFPTTQNVSGSVVGFQGGAPWANTNVGSVITVGQGSIATVIIGGSIAASFTPPANQSVSGAVTVSSLLSIPAIISTANSTTAPVTSTLSFTGTSEEWKDFGSIVVNVFTDAVSSVDGLSIQQSSNGTNWDITDTYTVPSMVGGQGKTFQVQPAARFGRVVYTQGAQNSGAFRLQTIYHPQMVKPTSQRAQDGYSNETDLEQTQGFNMIYNGSTWDRQRGNITNGTLIYGSVLATQVGTRITSVSGGVITSISGGISSVALAGANTVSVVGTIGASIVGQLPGGTAVLGSIATLQGTNPWIETFSNSSILAVPVGSVITVFQAPSIVGTYAEDAASASGDKGFLVMGARNDTLASVTSADGDYSSHVVGPAGELIAANAPFTKWVSGTGSMLGGTPVTGSLVPIIAAQGASVFTYITGIQIANASGTNAWITLLGATNSVIGFTIAPANGGSNIYYQNGLKTNANAAFSASISAVASVYVSAQGFIAKI